MQPHEIFVLRFILAYICLWIYSIVAGGDKQVWAASVSDEWQMAVLGITGGSLYFLTENMALTYSLANNVSFIVCTTPLITTLLALLFFRDVKATRNIIIGAVLALFGMALVIFNGHFILKLNPLGDFLALGAALCWSVYSLEMKKISDRYSALFLTRKVFFWGLITILPWFILHPWQFDLHGLLRPAVAGNLIFLGIIASFACYVLWAVAIHRIGAIKTSNYVYINPLSTVVASWLVLSEPMTPVAWLGAVLILLGVGLSNKGS